MRDLMFSNKEGLERHQAKIKPFISYVAHCLQPLILSTLIHVFESRVNNFLNIVLVICKLSCIKFFFMMRFKTKVLVKHD